MTPDPDHSVESPQGGAALVAEHSLPPDHAEAECRLLLLSDGRLLAHNLTPELHQLLLQQFPEG